VGVVELAEHDGDAAADVLADAVELGGGVGEQERGLVVGDVVAAVVDARVLVDAVGVFDARGGRFQIVGMASKKPRRFQQAPGRSATSPVMTARTLAPPGRWSTSCMRVMRLPRVYIFSMSPKKPPGPCMAHSSSHIGPMPWRLNIEPAASRQCCHRGWS
jgi:hypothetical protein